MKTRLYRPKFWKILVPAAFLTATFAPQAMAGRNANGALIVHTDDTVAYTLTGDYCLTDYLPASCEAAVTRTNKDEATPAVIWLLAAFPDTSSPAVTTIQFGIEHNLPANEGYFERYGRCGGLELPDTGWPETGFGNLLSFGSTARTEQLFPFYWFAAYGFEGAFFGPRSYPGTGEAKFVDDDSPPAEDQIQNFGTARWAADGENSCPTGQNLEFPLQGIYPKTIHSQGGDWIFLVAGIPTSEIQEVKIRVADRTYACTIAHEEGRSTSVWNVNYPPIRDEAASISVRTRRTTHTQQLALISKPTRHGRSGAIRVNLRKGTLLWDADQNFSSPTHQYRERNAVRCEDPTLVRLLDILGVTTIAKREPNASDGDSTWTGLDRVERTVPQALRSTYVLAFPSEYSAIAVGEILKAVPSVLSYGTVGSARPEAPCDGVAKGNSLYSLQWELQSGQEFPDAPWGIQANYAWCATAGAYRTIYQIDGPVNRDHPDLVGRIDPTTPALRWPNHPYGWSPSHGTSMAVVAVGSRDNWQGMVGAAPGATLFPLDYYYNEEVDPPGRFLDMCNYISQVHSDGELAVLFLPFVFTEYDEVDLEQAGNALNWLTIHENIAVLAAYSDDYPYPHGYPDVRGISGVTEDGYLVGDGLIIAPNQMNVFASWYTPYWIQGSNDGSTNSIATALAAGAATLLMSCSSLSTASAVYSKLEEVSATYGCLRVGAPCGYTGIQDIANVTAEPGAGQITLRWEVTNAEGIDGFSVEDSPSCMGPFETRIEWIDVGDPSYTTDGVHYAAVVSAPYEREYVERLVVMGGGESAYFGASAVPTTGQAVTLPMMEPWVSGNAVPGAATLCVWVPFQFMPPGLEFWIYRTAGGELPVCGPSDPLDGRMFRGRMTDGPGSCFCEPFYCQGWVDSDLIPGVTYTYRALLVERESLPNGIVKAATPLSDALVMAETADVPEGQVQRTNGVSLYPCPVRAGNMMTVDFSAMAGVGRSAGLDVFDSSGRLIRSVWKDNSPASKDAVGQSGSRIEVRADWGSGVYFVRTRVGPHTDVNRLVVVR